MAIQSNGPVKKAHVNLMTDTIIANLPPEGLRAVMRAILTTNPSFTSVFEQHTRQYLQKTGTAPAGALFTHDDTAGWQPTASFVQTQQRIRALMGCGMCFQSLSLLQKVIDQSTDLLFDQPSSSQREQLQLLVTSVDGDIVQALTAVQKILSQPHGARDFNEDEEKILNAVFESLLACRRKWKISQQEFLFDRSLSSVAAMLSRPSEDLDEVHDSLSNGQLNLNGGEQIPPPAETFELPGLVLPRLFSGLWQLSSPSWGVAPKSKIFRQFSNYVSKGFTAYDMADHYGDAEVLFGKFRASCGEPKAIFGATKYCVFQPTTVTPKLIHDNVTERCQRQHSDHVDLLQFHWQFYDDRQYIEALQLLQADERVRLLGLCNFDTERLEEILKAGIKIVTNQVQFSLIDMRPTIKMGKVCQDSGVKLLTYGTLCGGFLAEKWLGQSEPELFSDHITPSQRKYFEMILAWGSWSLFQELLQALKQIADKHGVVISNVATRWVLDFPYVGAVIVGARMGVSEHADQNLASYGWRLDSDDQKAINHVLSKSRIQEMFEVMGDCGGEYR